ncbi:MAG: transglycosylase domain-containing protein [Actinomycetota bacterium]|nr:transglycosylase domain-containing protein [Actinomycetota bacterium]
MLGRRRKEKKTKPRPRSLRILLAVGWLIPIGALLAGAAVLVFTYAFATIPLPEDVPLDAATSVYDRNGELIGHFTGEQRRFLLNDRRLDKLFKQAPHVGEAVISAEDKDFYDHDGVSLRGLARAAWANLTGGEIQQGGSTISQQYVKNAVLKDASRTITRKFKEAILAIKLERRYGKKTILGFYLNTIYLGRGAYGIQAASKAYFHKPATRLNLGEAAYLAGIIPSPESYQPELDMKAAVARRDMVLRVMREEGYISESQFEKASRGKIKSFPPDENLLKKQKAAYFMEWLRADYLDPLLGSCTYTCGLKIYTTLDLEAQERAEEALSRTKQEGWPEAALVSMTPDGAVRAMVGGKRYENVKSARGFNYATSFPGRQPGSAFKPFTLLTAIKQEISPSSYFSGASPVTIEDPACGTPAWQPENFGGSSYGTIDLRTATTNSVNTVYAQLIAEVGPRAVRDLVTDFGFHPPPGDSQIEPLCSLALGGSIDVTPLEMARAYAGFTNRGKLPEVNPVRYIKTNDNTCYEVPGAPATMEEAFEEAEENGPGVIPRLWTDCDKPIVTEGRAVVDQNSADVLNSVLTGVTTEGTAVSANLADYLEAGKTGTTQLNTNSWFVGSVPPNENGVGDTGLTTAVWMGYPLEEGKRKGPQDDYTPQMRYCYDPTNPKLCRPVEGRDVTGGSFPAEMWAAYMSEALPILNIDPAPWPVPRELPKNQLNSPPPSSTYVPPSPSESEEESPSPPPSSKEPPPTTEEPPPTTEEPPPTTEPPSTTVEPPPTTPAR